MLARRERHPEWAASPPCPLNRADDAHPLEGHEQERTVAVVPVLLGVEDRRVHRLEVVRRHPPSAVLAVALVQVAKIDVQPRATSALVADALAVAPHDR